MEINIKKETQLNIPVDVYRPYQRCEFCQSVYLTDNICESCGRSVRYDLIGQPFGYKSFYGIKERYVKALPLLVRLYPVFENIQSDLAKSHIRQIRKRLGAIAALSEHENLSLLQVEAFAIIDELIFYAVSINNIQAMVQDNLILEKYLLDAGLMMEPKKSWTSEVLDYKFQDVLSLKFTLQLFIICFSVWAIVNWQFGK